MNVNYNLLRTFVLVAERESFRDASERVHRSQSAVSAQIKLLEQQVGTELFHRTTRSVKLTRPGRQLYEAVRRGLREIDSGLRELSETLSMQAGYVVLASTPIIARALLAPVLAEFEKLYPAVCVSVKELPSRSLENALRNGDVDFGLAPTTRSAELDFEPLAREEIYAFVPRDLAGNRGDTLNLREVAAMPVLMLDGATSLRDLLDEAASQAGVNLRPKYECTQAQTLISMASQGLGVAILPGSIISSAPADRLKAMKIVNPEIKREVSLVRVHGHTLSPAASRLVEIIRHRTGTLSGQ